MEMVLIVKTIILSSPSNSILKFKANQIHQTVAVCIFFWCWLLVIMSCQSNHPESENYQTREYQLGIENKKLLILYDSADPYGSQCFEQTVIACQYAKILFEKFDLAVSTNLPDLGVYSSVASATEFLWKLDRIQSQKIEQFIRNGGRLTLLFRGWNDHLAAVFGVKNRRLPAISGENIHIYFEKEFLPGGKDLVIENQHVSFFKVTPEKAVTVIASAKNFPILWLNSYGKGKVLYWNTGILAQKINRGFIIRSIAAVQPYTAAVIANIGLFDLDDYPNSTSNLKLEPIKTEFNLTMTEFYVLKWYPDLLSLAKSFGTKYTAALIFNYNGRTSPPYHFYEWLNGKIKLGGKTIKSSIYAARSLNATTELGLHGYNHQPLTLKNWGSVENMKKALSAARHRWQFDNLGAEPQTYIPPLNVYDSTGINVVQQVFPEIKQIGALYLGNFSDGQYRDFGPEPWNQNLYVIPRNTAGCILTEFFRRSMISILNSNGIWAHFIHPDDVYPIGERYQNELLAGLEINSLSWYGGQQKNGIYYHLIKWMEFANEHYPWLRFLTRQQAYNVMQWYDRTQLQVSARGHIVDVESNIAPFYFAFYLDAKNKLEAMMGGELLHEYPTEMGCHFIFKGYEHNIIMHFRNRIIHERE